MTEGRTPGRGREGKEPSENCPPLLPAPCRSPGQRSGPTGRGFGCDVRLASGKVSAHRRAVEASPSGRGGRGWKERKAFPARIPATSLLPSTGCVTQKWRWGAGTTLALPSWVTRPSALAVPSDGAQESELRGPVRQPQSFRFTSETGRGSSAGPSRLSRARPQRKTCRPSLSRSTSHGAPSSGRFSSSSGPW